MSAVDGAKIWSLNYRVLLSVISCAEADIAALGLDSKELFLLAEIDDHPYPAELAATLSMPKATVPRRKPASLATVAPTSRMPC